MFEVEAGVGAVEAVGVVVVGAVDGAFGVEWFSFVVAFPVFVSHVGSEAGASEGGVEVAAEGEGDDVCLVVVEWDFAFVAAYEFEAVVVAVPAYGGGEVEAAFACGFY